MTRVLRIPQHDDEKSFVLVHVDGPETGTQSQNLDLTLVATEGSAPYVLRLKHSKVPSLKAKHSPCSKEEWILILESILLGKQADVAQCELLVGVEVFASVEENATIDIVLRKRTEGITQRLGTFRLTHDEGQEIELFEWCGVAVDCISKTANELTILQSKYIEQKDIIEKLTTQLEELITAKTSHESELLEKFRDILNEKKAKIRDQQRLLATAKVDPKRIAEVKAAQSVTGTRIPAQSRHGKRKFKQNDGDEQDEGEDSDNNFEKMDVDADQMPTDSNPEGAQTPDDGESETTDEDDEINIPPKSSAQETAQTRSGGKTDARDSTREKVVSKPSVDKTAQDNEEKTPPRRELPFVRKHATRAIPGMQEATADGGEDTASEDDDDEL